MSEVRGRKRTTSKKGAEPEVRPLDSPPSGPPPYDAAAVGRVAARIEIVSIELIGAHFDRSNGGPLPEDVPGELVPFIGIGDVKWAISADGSTLACSVLFGTRFEADPEPYRLIARFRLVYAISEGSPLAEADVTLFSHWNAVFNAWPYWREYLSSTLNRAQLPRFVVPVMGIPRSTG